MRPEGAPCNFGGLPELRLFDLGGWDWVDGALLRADAIGRVAWSPDGSRLYAPTSSRESWQRGPAPPSRLRPARRR